ncbi:MAG: methylmalonyl-CoA epimerase [Chloroflexi bacterium]|nr:methylmalonyl-CoA epimerase [Chloroflexota bacterium]
MIKKVDHIGVAVKSISEALSIYTDALKLGPVHEKVVPEFGVKVAFLPVGDTEIELLEPLDDSSSVAKFIEKRGEGIHHICLETDDIEAELKNLMEKGVDLLDKAPRQGAVARVAFVHPKSARGVLLELSERL